MQDFGACTGPFPCCRYPTTSEAPIRPPSPPAWGRSAFSGGRMSDEGFLQRLKQRKVVQWTLAHLAGAWVVCEATGTAAEIWNLSPLILRSIHVLPLAQSRRQCRQRPPCPGVPAAPRTASLGSPPATIALVPRAPPRDAGTSPRSPRAAPGPHQSGRTSRVPRRGQMPCISPSFGIALAHADWIPTSSGRSGTYRSRPSPAGTPRTKGTRPRRHDQRVLLSRYPQPAWSQDPIVASVRWWWRIPLEEEQAGEANPRCGRV